MQVRNGIIMVERQIQLSSLKSAQYVDHYCARRRFTRDKNLKKRSYRLQIVCDRILSDFQGALR